MLLTDETGYAFEPESFVMPDDQTLLFTFEGNGQMPSSLSAVLMIVALRAKRSPSRLRWISTAERTESEKFEKQQNMPTNPSSQFVSMFFTYPSKPLPVRHVSPHRAADPLFSSIPIRPLRRRTHARRCGRFRRIGVHLSSVFTDPAVFCSAFRLCADRLSGSFPSYPSAAARAPSRPGRGSAHPPCRAPCRPAEKPRALRRSSLPPRPVPSRQFATPPF